jgi:hypothetical protein
MNHSQDYVTKRTLIVCSLIVGFGLALALGGVIWIAFAINNVQQDEISHNSDRTAKEAATNRRQARLIHDLRVITHPTPAQYRRQIREGIKRCLREPRCRRLFPALARSARSGGRSTVAKPGLARSPGATSTPVRRPQGVGPSASSPTRPARPQRRPPSRTPATPPTTPPSPAAPPAPHHAIDVTAPIPAQVCADGLLGLNC